ncbi:hypothetical protein HHK36_012400 [Tetracentron sinense]|uniref:Pectinesterase inhibitor domain-containing protein n=1 Tax=Tetracentron sinense TaxID=13715 RepID=A0A835DFP2_TETSI|nr:hypothetical protein HHK36_012400 [Tetracentron sinense]
MTSVNAFSLIMVLVCVTQLVHSTSQDGDDYVREACNVTQYRDLCIHSLASFSNSAKRSPHRWARAAVSVTLSEAKRVTEYLTKMSKSGGMMGREGMALLDCVQCFEDTIDNLHDSLGELRRLVTETFDTQVNDVETWMSAALTDEETCLDGFSERKGRRVKALRNRVLNVTYATSNALAFVTNLAMIGAGNLTNPLRA